MHWEDLKIIIFAGLTGDPVYTKLYHTPRNERKAPESSEGWFPAHLLYNFDFSIVTNYIKNIFNFIYRSILGDKNHLFYSFSTKQGALPSCLYLDLDYWFSQHGGFLFYYNLYFYKKFKYFFFNQPNFMYSYRAEISTFKYDSFFYISLIIFLFLSFLSLVWFADFFSRINSNYFKNEKIFDDYNTNVNFLVESEKELGSLDDMFLGISVFICIYGWFFGANSISYIFNCSEFYFVYVGFPILLLTILGMPLNMIWDYGLAFVTFLRGSSNTTIFSLEFMYDLLATTIMFIRLIVQNVRYLLMFFAFLELFEFYASYSFLYEDLFYSSDKTFYDFISTTNLVSFFFFNFSHILSFSFLYVYNLFHLLYTVSSHFFAYLILVFWFFCFLYTIFFSKKLENFFKSKRNSRR